MEQSNPPTGAQLTLASVYVVAFATLTQIGASAVAHMIKTAAIVLVFIQPPNKKVGRFERKQANIPSHATRFL